MHLSEYGGIVMLVGKRGGLAGIAVNEDGGIVTVVSNDQKKANRLKPRLR